MSNLFRDTSLGQVIRLVTGNKVLLYPEEREGFVAPGYCSGTPAFTSSRSSSVTAVDRLNTPPSTDSPKKAAADAEKGEDKTEPLQPAPGSKLEGGYILVGWYGDDDPDNPQNWTMRQKIGVAGVITGLTFAVYVAASIITPSTAFIISEFGVSEEVATLVLALYVAAYGTGPLIFSPLSEIPSVGRTPLYVGPYAVVFLLSIGLPLSPTFAGLAILRFLTGFLASPALATGGASMADIFPPNQIPYAFVGWSLGAVFGPALGPTLSVFATQHFQTWRWSMWIQLMITGIAWILVFTCLPETSAPNILLRRARRLRKLTGNKKLRSQSEIDQAGTRMSVVLKDALIKPFQIAALDPAVLYADFLIAFLYATYYLFFTAFPIVLMGTYGWSIESESLAFLSIVIFIGLAAIIYWAYVYYIGSKLPFDKPERRLDTALIAVCLSPIGLFMYAWTDYPSISPYVGLLGIGLFSAAIFVCFQTVMFYIALSYPVYAASILAGNDFMRSLTAAGIIMCGLPFYNNLGNHVATSILGGISVLFIPLTFGLHQFGPKLRARSRFAVS